MTWLLDKRPLRRILLTRLRYLGDVVMTTPMLTVLRAGDPEVQLGYLCEAAHGAALQGHPWLKNLHLLGAGRTGADARARVQAVPTGSGRARGTWGLIRELRAAHYDLVVDLFFNPRSAWLLRLSGIGQRIGGATSLRRHLYTHTALAADGRARAPRLAQVAPGGLGDHLARLAPLTHAETGLDFLSWLVENFSPGQLKPELGKDDQAGGTPYLLLAPGATWPAKEWPRSHWQELVGRLVAESGLPVRVLVPPGREETWGALGAGYERAEVEVLPRLPLVAVKRVLSAARTVVSVDGGVMHMAVGLGVPTVGLFGPTDPATWFPYEEMGPYRVLAQAPPCFPCDRHECDEFICLPELPADRVAAVVLQLSRAAGPVADRQGE